MLRLELWKWDKVDSNFFDTKLFLWKLLWQGEIDKSSFVPFLWKCRCLSNVKSKQEQEFLGDSDSWIFGNEWKISVGLFFSICGNFVKVHGSFRDSKNEASKSFVSHWKSPPRKRTSVKSSKNQLTLKWLRLGLHQLKENSTGKSTNAILNFCEFWLEELKDVTKKIKCAMVFQWTWTLVLIWVDTQHCLMWWKCI